MVENGIVIKPISIREVANLIGAATNDLGTLCAHKNVNMWSRCKPVVYPALSADIRNASVNGANYRYALPKVDGNEVNYADGDMGITLMCNVRDLKDSYPNLTINTDCFGKNMIRYKVTGSDTLELRKYQYDAMMALYEYYEWVRIPPQGGQYSPYRLGDFDGYNHNAKPPYVLNDACFNQSVNAAVSNNMRLYFASVEANDDNSVIGIEDFAKLGNINFNYAKIVVIAKYNDSTYYYAESSDWIMPDVDDPTDYLSSMAINTQSWGTNRELKFYAAIAQQDPNNPSMWVLLPIITQSKSFPGTLNIKTDTAEAGAGIKDWKTDVWFCVTGTGSGFDDASKSALAYNLIEEGNPTKYIATSSRYLSIKIKFYNSTNSEKTWYRTDVKFTTELYTDRVAEQMIGGTDANTIKVPANGTKEVIFCFNVVPILPEVKASTNKYIGSEITLKFRDIFLFGGSLYHQKSSGGDYIANI